VVPEIFATRTVRLRIARSTNPGKLAALEATVAEWNRAVAFYTDLFLSHPDVFSARKTEVVREGPHAGTTRQPDFSEAEGDE